MIDTIEAIDNLNLVIDKLDNVKDSTDTDKMKSGIDDALDELRTWKSKKEDELDLFEKTMKKEYDNKMPVGELANDPIK
jgi:transcriptional regulator NrdR family protein|tara:strand:- start:193 stop:429 length:237 start_codon:yes stop_codon:yes gene_type:complete